MNQQTLLYVNDQLLDLYDESKEPIQIVMQANNLGNLNSMEASYTKQFNIPLTANNKAILGFPGEIFITPTSAAKSPYNYYKAKLVYSGIEIIPSGKLLVTQVTDKSADVTVISGNADLLDLLGGSLYDMGDSTTPSSGFGSKLVWQAFDHIWNTSNAANSQTKTDGWIWPIVNYGDVDTRSPFAGYINVRNQRPAFFVKTAIELLMQSAGYTIDKSASCLYSDARYAELYKRLLVPFSNGSFDHGSDYQAAPNNDGMATILGTQFVFNPGPAHQGVIPFNSDYGPVTKNIDGTASIEFDIMVMGTASGSAPTTVFITIVVDDTIAGTSAILAESSFDLSNGATLIGVVPAGKLYQKIFTQQKLSADVELVPGMQVRVTYGVTASAYTTFVISKGATFNFVPSEKAVLWQQEIQCERIFPDISQIDLLKFVLQTFGLILIANPNKGTVTFASYKRIVANIPIARDWSDKCIDAGKLVQFNLGSFAQINWLRYQDDSAIPVNLMPKYFADDDLTIADKTLSPNQPAQDLFTSPFAPSLNAAYHGGTIAQISNPTDASTNFGVGSAPRLLIDQKVDLRTLGSNPDGSVRTVIFADNDLGFTTETIPVNGIISVPYFYKTDAPVIGSAPRHLCWCDKGGMAGLKSSYYSEFAHILDQTKKVTRYFMLSPMDIQNFDFLIPVYIRQDNAHYYVNQFTWVKGQPCKVELIRL